MKFQYNHARLLKIILGGLVLVCVGLTFYSRLSETQKSVIEPMKIDVTHSFTTEATGLAKLGITTNEHNISRLNKYDIKKTVRETFKCRDLDLEEDHILTIGDMVIPLSGYDPEHKIGYVWLDYNLFGEGILDLLYSQYKSQKNAEQVFLNQVEKGIELFFENQEGFLLDVFGEEPLEQSGESTGENENILDDEIEVFPDISIMTFENQEEFFKNYSKRWAKMAKYKLDKPVNVTREKWDFFEGDYSDSKMLYQFGQEIKDRMYDLQIYEDRREYLEIMFVEFKKMIFLSELNSKKSRTFIDDWKFSAAEMIDDPIRFFGFVERINYLEFPFASNPLTKAMESEILKITLTTDKKKWWKHSEAIINLLQTNKTTVINSKKDYDLLLAEIINYNPYHKWPDHYYKIDDLGNKYTISLAELEVLPRLASSHGICIAPLSILDDRSIYNMQEQEYQDKLAALREKINRSKNKIQRKSYKEDLMALSQYRSLYYGKIRDEAKAKSMQKIIEDMESFLDWSIEISANWERRAGA